jgi:hypothetical protein
MQPPDVSPLAGTAQSTGDMSPVHPRLAYLVARFRRSFEAQRARDAELVAGLERVARNPRVRHIIQGILQESNLMTKIKHTKNAGSTRVIPKFGRARHDQQVKSAWASERHDPPAATARQPRSRRKAGSYGAR